MKTYTCKLLRASQRVAAHGGGDPDGRYHSKKYFPKPLAVWTAAEVTLALGDDTQVRFGAPPLESTEAGRSRDVQPPVFNLARSLGKKSLTH